jgi:hypothetical protein
MRSLCCRRLRRSLDGLTRSSSRSRNYKALSSDESTAPVASTTITQRSSPSSSIDRNQCGRGQCIRSGYKTCYGRTSPSVWKASYAGTRLLVMLVISRLCRAMAWLPNIMLNFNSQTRFVTWGMHHVPHICLIRFDARLGQD